EGDVVAQAAAVVVHLADATRGRLQPCAQGSDRGLVERAVGLRIDPPRIRGVFAVVVPGQRPLLVGRRDVTPGRVHRVVALLELAQAAAVEQRAGKAFAQLAVAVAGGELDR